jgi:sulfur transfer protein SufE
MQLAGASKTLLNGEQPQQIQRCSYLDKFGKISIAERLERSRNPASTTINHPP